jgi:hypothetical protein
MPLRLEILLGRKNLRHKFVIVITFPTETVYFLEVNFSESLEK